MYSRSTAVETALQTIRSAGKVRGRRSIAAAFTCLCLALLLLVLAIDYSVLLPLDVTIASTIQQETAPMFFTLMVFVSVLGKFSVATALTVGSAAVLRLKRRWLEAAFVLASGSSLLISSLIKQIVGRERPVYELRSGSLAIETFNGYSFPSGHVVFFVTFLGFLGYLAWKHLCGVTRWAVISTCGVLIALVGPSRIYLGAHWATDVLGGYVVGAMLLLALVLFYERKARSISCSERPAAPSRRRA